MNELVEKIVVGFLILMALTLSIGSTMYMWINGGWEYGLLTALGFGLITIVIFGLPNHHIEEAIK
jgi:hypothetical protein